MKEKGYKLIWKPSFMDNPKYTGKHTKHIKNLLRFTNKSLF
jgi:hypothetical protein